MVVLRLSLLCTFALVCAAAEGYELWNPTGREWVDEPVRVPVALGAAAGLQLGDQPVRHMVIPGGRDQGTWIAANLPKDGRLAVGPGAAAGLEPLVQVRQADGWYELDNGLVAVRVSDGSDPARAPIGGIRQAEGAWLGMGHWQDGKAPQAAQASLVGTGMVFASVHLTYTDAAGGSHEVLVRLDPGRAHCDIEERHQRGAGTWWTFACRDGWQADKFLCEPFGMGFGKWRQWLEQSGRSDFPPTTLAPDQTRMGEILINLSARWNQAYDDGWFAALHDGTQAVMVMAARAGSWQWPHDNLIEVRTGPEGGRCDLRLPLRHGARRWVLGAGALDQWQDGKKRHGYAMRFLHAPPSKLVDEFILDWPAPQPDAKGRKPKPARFALRNIYDDGQINPTGFLRQVGRSAMRDAMNEKKMHGGFGQLSHGQWILHPDTYGSYWLGWSPENPNFFTDLIKPGIADLSRMTKHPRWPDIKKLIEQTIRTDLYHSVTLPGGAGQECPGYLNHALHQWKAMAPLLLERCGIDLKAMPRYQEAHRFLIKLSQPLGPDRTFHPGGDTHPGRPDPAIAAAKEGITVDVAALETEELPGFGAIFRHRPATGRETYFAFKSGPSRGHYHGDQLSFHYGANGHPVAVDHHCSYGPRAGQEHMHNRLALVTDDLPYANMDGHERLIAFKKSAGAAAAIGQVSSKRLRATTQHPPELWDWQTPSRSFARPMTYRRTVVHIVPPDGSQDFFVLRDHYRGPELTAVWCLHVLGETMQQDGHRFTFDGLTVQVAQPAEYLVAPFDWEHENGGREATKGLRLAVDGAEAEFITVLYPHPTVTEQLCELRLRQALQPEWKKPPKKGGSPKPLDMVLRLVVDGAAVVKATAMAPGLLRKPVVATATVAGDRLAVSLELPGGRKFKPVAWSGSVPRSVLDPKMSKVGSWQAGERSGAIEPDYRADVPAMPVQWQQTDIPAITPVSKGVQVGSTTVVFSDIGGVSVSRDGTTILAVTDADIDLNRSQGEVGLFVPDAGYPFGPIPQWLIDQRSKRPDWQEDIFPLGTAAP